MIIGNSYLPDLKNATVLLFLVALLLSRSHAPIIYPAWERNRRHSVTVLFMKEDEPDDVISMSDFLNLRIIAHHKIRSIIVQTIVI